MASRHSTQGFPQRIQAAFDWVVTSENYCHESALEAYAMFFELLDGHSATRSTTISRCEATTAFHYARSLPADAASCAVRRENLPKAVELVEQGRGQQWSLVSRLRTPLDDLDSMNPSLAHEFSELSERLFDFQGSTGNTDAEGKKYRDLAKQWDAVVAETCNLRGFSRFLLSPSYKELQVAARQDPVIASKYSCSALLVPTSVKPRHVAFQNFTFAELEKLKDDFVKVIRHAAGMCPEESRKDLQLLLQTLAPFGRRQIALGRTWRISKGKPLTLLDIMKNNAPQAEFSFLSACHTDASDEKTPDEVIHLTAGLQFSGFKSVIGTLWAIDDALAKYVVQAFYENMFKNLKEGVMDCTKAASALNHATATSTVKKKKVPLEQIIVFIHIEHSSSHFSVLMPNERRMDGLGNTLHLLESPVRRLAIVLSHQNFSGGITPLASVGTTDSIAGLERVA
ncbi:hypothetical protein BDR07DRAFT_1463318 [Suillus spraguei]|nr:hypothetical protein BDR07DRAFT_1463318 [Suillus spraguei]